MKQSDELFKQDLIATAAIKRITEENKYNIHDSKPVLLLCERLLIFRL